MTYKERAFRRGVHQAINLACDLADEAHDRPCGRFGPARPVRDNPLSWSQT